MKKILSLVALLVVTVAAMAQSYTDNEVVKVGYNTESTFDNKALQVDANGDGTYNVTFLNVQNTASNVTDDYGDFLFSGLTGTTENGITTLTGSDITIDMPNQGSDAVPNGATLTANTLTVKFTGDKAYAKMEGTMKYTWVFGTKQQAFNVTFGTDEFSPGGGTVDPVEEYPINFDKDANITHNSRYTSSISLEANGQKQTANTTIRKAYEDLTSTAVFTVPAGSECTPTFGFNGEWMHGYVYIDLNNDKQFSWNAEGNDQSGTELVSYSYLGGTNSKGESVAGSVGVNGPSFTAPTTPGTYRIRYKIDWDNADPGGNGTSSNNILNNGGGIWDATLVVEAATTPFEPVTVSYEDDANVKFGETTTDIDNAQLDVTEYEEGKYKVTYKNVTVASYQIGDLTFDNLSATTGDDNVTTYTLAADSKATWSNVAEGNIINANEGDEATFRNFEATVTPVEGADKGKAVVKFGINVTGEWADFTFGEKGEPVLPEPTVYTDKAHTTYWGEFDYENKVVSIYNLGDNKYKVVYNGYNLGSSTTFDLVLNNVEGTTDEQGYTTYTFDGQATTENVQVDPGVIASVSEGGVVDATLNGKSKDGKLYATFTMTTMGSTATTVYGSDFTTDPEPPACEFTDVVEHGYAPAGQAWKEDNVAIDWNTQYIKAELDLTNCATNAGNVLSVGRNIADWFADGFHFYYYPTSKMLEVDYVTSDESALGKGNPIRTQSIPAEGVVTIEISKANGVVVNGTEYNVLNGVDESKKQTAYDEFFAQTSVQVGGCQGDNMSDATYNYIHVLEAPASVVDTKTFTDKLTVQTGEDQTFDTDASDLTIEKYSDGSYKVTITKFYGADDQVLTFNVDADAVEESTNEDGGTHLYMLAETTYGGTDVYVQFAGNYNGNWAHFQIDLFDEGETVEVMAEYGAEKTDGIRGLNAEAAAGNAQIFSVNGAKVNSLQKGVNIVRMANGKTVKVLK